MAKNEEKVQVSKDPVKGERFDLSKVDYRKKSYRLDYPSAKLANKGMIPKDKALEILEKFHLFSQCEDHNITFRGFALLIQEGGANRSKNNISVTVDGKEFSLELLKTAIKQSVSTNSTVRQLARTLNEEILKVALAEGLKGPLVNELKKIESSSKRVKEEEYPYCNEIFSENENTPRHIKKYLDIREEQIKTRNDKKPSKQQTLPRRSRGK